MIKQTIVIKESKDFRVNDIIAEVRWVDLKGNLKHYVFKKTKNDVLALASDSQKCYIKSDRNIGLR